LRILRARPERRRPAIIWWIFDYRQRPPRTRIFIGTGMTKIKFASVIEDIYGMPELYPRSKIYRETYGGAWWRITDPWFISIAKENYGKVVLVDEKTREILGTW